MTSLPKGFNLIGYATSPMGLGEDLRSFAAILDHLEIPFSVTDVPTDVQGRVSVSWRQLSTRDYETSVFFMSPMECQKLADIHPKLFRQPKRKVGYFLWELPDFPSQHVPALKLVDHIWCPTRFVQETFFAKSRQFTLILPLPVVQCQATRRDFRKELNVDDEAFVCLFMFDLHSTLARKNPQAVLRVFLNFARDNQSAYLFLKVNRWQNMKSDVSDWIPFHPRVKIIKETLSPGEITDLYRSANCYLSLHRSEGFGRTLIEAMQNGLQIVSTDFSGPKDFLTAENAHLVNWSRIEVKEGEYPNLSQPSWWAEPDEASALFKLEQAHLSYRSGPNTKGQSDGAQFSHHALAIKYSEILKTYLK